MKKILFIAGAFLSITGYTQKKNTPPFFAASIDAADLKKHLYIVAGKEMEGRDTPSPGLEKAADYIENHFRALGLVPGNKGSFRQVYPIYKDTVLSTHLKVNESAFELTKDFQPNLN